MTRISQQQARLAFYTAAQKILAETLRLMGMTTPETMYSVFGMR